MTIIYGIIALISFVLAAAYWRNGKRDTRFMLLFASVFLVNAGYFLLSVSKTVELALIANRISYFGAAYSVLIMLLIIMDVCQVKTAGALRGALICISTGAFLLAASGGILDVYYSQVSIEIVNGMTILHKVYGPLHILYAMYLLTYFALMIITICYAWKRKKLESPQYAFFLAAVVLGNIGVWLVEQLLDVDFEFLSISYVATEILLLLLYSLLQDYGILRQTGELNRIIPDSSQETGEAASGELPPEMEEMFSDFAKRIQELSSAEMRILKYYVDGHDICEIPDLAMISINTVRKHNRSIYQKLGVSSKDELMLYIELFRRCGRLDELNQEV